MSTEYEQGLTDCVLLLRRLDTSFRTLFWTLFGLIPLTVLEIKLRYTRVFGKVLFGLYNLAARILLLNILIAMMTKTFKKIVVSLHAFSCEYKTTADSIVQPEQVSSSRVSPSLRTLFGVLLYSQRVSWCI
jgi:hypothetical protein